VGLTVVDPDDSDGGASVSSVNRPPHNHRHWTGPGLSEDFEYLGIGSGGLSRPGGRRIRRVWWGSGFGGEGGCCERVILPMCSRGSSAYSAIS